MDTKSNPLFFIKIMNGKLILWDCRAHTQYEVSSSHVQRLLDISRGSGMTKSALDLEIASTKILADDDRNFAEWGWDCLSHIFHVGTQIVLKGGASLPSDDSYEGYVAYCSSIVDRVPEIKYERKGDPIDLPIATRSFSAAPFLVDVLLGRRTSRSFIADPVPLQTVADVMYWTFGTVHGDKREDMLEAGLIPVGYRRTSPSGGSLHPSEAYLVALRVTGLHRGIYHYRASTHQITLVTEKIDGETLGQLLCAQMFAQNLGFGVFVTSRFDKMWWKYPHSRAYRVALLDVGCLAQTFQLVATGLGLNSWITGYFFDREINRLLAVDEINESVLFFLGAGIGKNVAFAPELLAAIDKQRNVV